MRTPLVVLVALLTPACTGHLDREIVRLDSEIALRKVRMSEISETYHAPSGADMEIKVGAEPLLDVLREIDRTPSLQRTVVVRSIDRSGRLAEAWTRCWPFKRKMGIYLSLAHDNALYSIFHLGRTNPRWRDSDGLEFDFDVKGAGAALIAIGAKFCVGSGNLGAFPVVAVMPPLQQTKGRLRLTAGRDGVAYELLLDRPPYFVLGACALGLCAGAPVRMDRKLQSGLIANPVGNEGEVQISKTGEVRRYKMDFQFNQPTIVPGGLSVSGLNDITWTTGMTTADAPTPGDDSKENMSIPIPQNEVLSGSDHVN